MALGLCACAPPSGTPDRDVVYLDASGRTITRLDLAPFQGKLDGEVVWWDKPVPPDALELQIEGRHAVRAGDYRTALGVFTEAHQIAPDWPSPVHDTAWVYLLMDENEQAIASYAQAAAMAPRGFYNVTQALDTLRREEMGSLPRGSYRKLVLLLIGPPSTNLEMRTALLELLETATEFPAAWAALSQQVGARNKIRMSEAPWLLEKIDYALSYEPDAQTRGHLLIDKALVTAQLSTARRDEAIQILGSLALDPGSPLDVEQTAKEVLVWLLRH
jgi:hypothetical protein